MFPSCLAILNQSCASLGCFSSQQSCVAKRQKTHPAQTCRNTITRKLCSLQSVFKYQKVNNYEAIFEGTNCGHRRWKRVLQEPGIALVVSHLLNVYIQLFIYSMYFISYPILSYPIILYSYLYIYICEVLQTPSKNNTTQCWVGYDTTYRSSFMEKTNTKKKHAIHGRFHRHIPTYNANHLPFEASSWPEPNVAPQWPPKLFTLGFTTPISLWCMIFLTWWQWFRTLRLTIVFMQCGVPSR